MNHYQVLGVKEDAERDEIRRAYRRLAAKTHPDIAGEVMTPLFLGIQAAYEELGDPERRARYDRTNNFGRPAPTSPAPPAAPNTSPNADPSTAGAPGSSSSGSTSGQASSGSGPTPSDSSKPRSTWRSKPSSGGRKQARSENRQTFERPPVKTKVRPLILSWITLALVISWAGLSFFLGSRASVSDVMNAGGTEFADTIGALVASGVLAVAVIWSWNRDRTGRSWFMGPVFAAAAGVLSALGFNSDLPFLAGLNVGFAATICVLCVLVLRRHRNLKTAGLLGRKSGPNIYFEPSDTDHRTAGAAEATWGWVSDLANMPGVRVIHDLPADGESIQLIIINADRAAVVDSRVSFAVGAGTPEAWAQALSSVNTTISFGSSFVRRPGLLVQGWLVLQPSLPGRAILEPNMDAIKLTAVSPDLLGAEIMEWLYGGKRAGMVDREAIYRVIRGQASWKN